jgi:predicted house-cleaning noncanonical NTP pyrophosphatase (MazG superfamily)
VIIGGKMSTAKERYYEFKSIADKCFEGLRDPIHDYVTELEQEKAELIELIKRIAIANGIDPEKLELLQKHNTK